MLFRLIKTIKNNISRQNGNQRFPIEETLTSFYSPQLLTTKDYRNFSSVLMTKKVPFKCKILKKVIKYLQNAKEIQYNDDTDSKSKKKETCKC